MKKIIKNAREKIKYKLLDYRLNSALRKAKNERNFPIVSLRNFVSSNYYIAIAILIVAFLAITPYLARISSLPSGPIAISLDYNSGTNFDENDDGIEQTTGVVDFSLKSSLIDPELENTKLSAKWEVYSLDDGTLTTLCHGSDDGCSFIGLKSSSENWNDAFYLYYGKDGATENNIVSAMIFYFNSSESTASTPTIYYSGWLNRSATFLPEKITSIWGIEHTLNCDGCEGNKVPEQTNVEIKIRVNGNITNETFEYYYPPNLEYGENNPLQWAEFNSSHNIILWNLENVENSVERIFEFKSPFYNNGSNESNNYNFQYSIKNLSGTYDFIVVPLNNTEINLSMNITLNISTNLTLMNISNITENAAPVCNLPFVSILKNTESQINLDEYCTDAEGDKIEYSSGLAENISVNLFNSTLALTPDINFTGIRYLIITANDSINHSSYNLTLGVLDEILQKPVCTLIPNITIEKNSNFTMNLGDFCSDASNSTLYFSSYETENIEVGISGSDAIIIPIINFTGTEFMFFTVNNSKSVTVTNVFRIDVTEMSESETVIQLDAEINRPVKWQKKVKYGAEKQTAEINVPKDAFNIKVMNSKDDSVLDIEASKITVDDNGISKGLDEYETDKQIDLLNKKLKRTSDKFKKSEIQSRLSEFEDKKSSIGRARNKPFFSSIIGIFANQEEQADENKIIINESAKELLVEFETEGPEKEESFDGKTRTVKIYSDLHYENVLAYTDIPDAQAYTINIQWINNGTNVPFTNYTLLDMNSNGLPDRIEWRVPHLSNQTFEIGLQILNVQSYPIVGGNWTVSFNTLGTSNLTISAQSPTSYSEKAIDKTATFNDLDVLEIKCNSTILFNYGLGIISANVYLVNGTGQRLKINDTMGKSANIKSVFVQDYNCDNQTGYLTVRVLSQGVHIQRFDFGNLTAYANNYALSGPVFLDDTDIDFSNSALFRTNISGSGAGANVTLNYTIENTFQVYNMSGNFTSRIFNTGQNHTVFDKIAWEPLLPNSSEVVGYTSHTTAGDIAVFYRNGSFAVNLTTAALTANIGFREGGLRRYTIPAGFDYNDIIGFASRDQTTDEFVFYINGSTSADTTQADYTSDIAYANGQNTWTIPAGFNATEIIDFEINSDGTDSAVFFKNGTFIVAAAETPPLAFATVRLYTVPAGFNTRDIIGFSYHEGANDVVAFFRNGTIISDTAQLNFGSDIAFATVLNSIYPTDLNLTETTNITLQTRISNDSTTFTNWSSVYIDPSGAQTLDAQYGKFIQYRAAFYSPWEYITPFLQNVSINYTLDLLLTSINASINNTSPRIGMNINITANLSDVSGVFLCQFIDNQSLNGAKRSFNFTLSQNDGKCSQNFTISRSRGNVINFSAVGYDIYNNTNQTDFIITVANTDVGTPTILYPINQSFVSQQPLPFNVTFPGDADGDPIDITFYINGIINQTTQINTTFNASDGTYILNVSISDGFSVSQNVSINFTLDTTLPSINGSLNKSPDSIRTGNSINATFNATDNTGLDTGQILVNDTGIVRIFNFSLNGVKNAQFSQNITISCTRGCVVNITGIVNDSVNGMRQNSTVFTVGNTAPAAPTILFPTQDLYTSRQPLPINVTFPADADNDPITIRYYINGIPNGTSLVNTTFNASDGYYILNVSLFDGFDSGPNATVNFTLDTTPPSVMLVYPENATYNTSGFLQMSYTATDQLISQCQLYTNFSGVWKLNQTNLTLASGVLSFFNRTQNTEGRFAWDVFCNDTLGNSRFNSSNFTVIVDVTFPKIEFANPTPQNNSNLSSPTQIFNVTYFENNPGTLIFSLNGSLPNESMNYYNGPLNFTNLTKTGLYGTYDFYFWANDSVGRNNQTEIRTINIDTGFPRVSLEAPLNNTWNNSEPQLFTYIPTDYFTGVKNCSIVFDTGAVISTNITSGNLTGTYADFGGNYTNITGKNDNSFWFFGQVNTDGLPFVIDASANITFNASGINPSIVKSLDFDISYCHSGSAPGSIGCSGVAPSATIEVEQEVSVYNFSSGNWVLIGNLQNDADGTGGNLVNDRFNINGNLRDMVNSSNQMRLGVRSRMTSVVIGNSFLVLDYVNLTVVTSINENDIADDTTEMFSNNLDNGDYNWRVECSDYASNLNSSETRILRVDRTVPSIFNESINSTSIGINRQICLNVTVHDTISGPKYVYAEIDRPLSGLTNKSMTNDTQDPNSCGGQGGNVWSFAYTALEDGMANWTSTYAEDYAGNINSTHTFGLNWSQTASVFVNLTIMQPLFDITINESDLDVNYSFMMGCNLTCRPDSAVLCNGTYIKAQYFNNSWNDITNFSSQLFTDKLNKTCGNLAIGQSCNATFNITSSTSSGNNIFPLRCYGKGFNTPQDFSEIVPNVTINDHPTALFTSPADSQVISGFLIINASGSFDDFVVSRYQIELDDNPLFGSPSALCDTNLANCTFNTFAQTQCAEENSECYLRLNVTDNNSLKNSTFIRTEIDNIAPIIRLETPLNNTYSSIAGIDFIYTPIDGNILSCSLYNNESGTFQIMETNDTVLNNSQDVFFETLPEKNIIWNIGCNDTAANFAFNSTNFTLTIDLSNPKIDFTFPTLANNTFARGSHVVINVSINESNFANTTFYLYDSSLDLVNETNFTSITPFLNITSLTDQDEIYYYNATARDKSGRENSTETRIITLDNTAPLVNFTGPTSPNNTFAIANYIFVNVSIIETNFQNATFYLYDSAFNIINATNITDFAPYIFVNFTPSNVNQRYYYNVTVRDKVLLEASTETREIVLDNAAPAVTFNSPANNTLTFNNTIPFNFTPTDSNLKNCSLFANFSLTGSFEENTTISAQSGIQNIITTTAINDGDYIWNIRCFDYSEQFAFNSTNYTIRIDSTHPLAFGLDQQPNDTQSVIRSPFLNWTESIDLNFGNYTLLVDDNSDFSSADFVYGLGGNYSNNSITVPDQWADNTRFYWKVIAFDSLNQSMNSTSTFTYITDSAPPQINLSSPTNNSETTSSVVNFVFNVTDQFTVSNCSLVINNEAVSTSSSISKDVFDSIQYSPGNGNFNWSINCTDKAGNVNSSVFKNMTVNAPALLPTKFVDTSDIDFGQGTVYRTNVTGTGNDANVTLNYTVINTFNAYNTSGNFTSRLFDTGAANTNLSNIKWTSLLPNSSEVIGYSSQTTSGDIAVFYRNGSFAANLTTAALTANIGFREGGLRRYTIPAGFDYNDIIGFATRDQTTDEFVFYINGSTSADTTQADYTSDISYANGQNTWTIPAGFNATEIIDFEINSDGTDSAVFFKNGTFIVAAAETPPLAFATPRVYTVPAGFNTRDIIGFSYHEGGNDITAFFRNGTMISDTTQTDFSTNIAFATVLNSIYPTDLNLTETTNITLQTRISNDSTTFTNWSSVYIDPSGTLPDDRVGQFIQYKAVFTSPWKYITPFLLNVTLNYTDFNPPKINFTVPTPINNTFTKNNYLFINATVFDGQSIEKCVLELNGFNYSMLIERDSRNATCYYNATSLSEGAYGFRVYANDSFGNMNFSETRNVTVDLTPPTLNFVSQTPSIVYNIDNVTLIAESSDNYRLNSTIIGGNWTGIFVNESLRFMSGINYNFTIFSSNLSGGENVAYRFYANDTAGNIVFTSQFNFTVVRPLAATLIVNPLYSINRYENETLFVNATLTAVNGTIRYCSLNITNQTGLTVIGYTNRTIGNLTNGTASAVFGWELNGTIPDTYYVNVTSNCTEGERSVSVSPEIIISPTNSSLSDSHFAERKTVAGVQYFHLSSETGVQWWFNGTDEYINFDPQSPQNSWMKNRWTLKINNSINLDFNNFTWDIRRTGADSNLGYVFIQFIGRMQNPAIRVNFTKIIYSNSQADNITFDVENMGAVNLSDAKLFWSFEQFNANLDSDTDTLVIQNATGEIENYPMDSSTSLNYNRSRFNPSQIFFTDSDTDIRGSIYWDANMTLNSAKQPLNNFTFSAGGTPFSLNFTFGLGQLNSSQLKILDPGAGLATPGNIRRTGVLNTLFSNESGTSYTDVTVPLTDNNFATQDFIVARTTDQVRILNIVNNTEISGFDDIYLKVRVDTVESSPFPAFVFAYDVSNISIINTSYSNRTFITAEAGSWVNINITTTAHLLDGRGYIRVRLAPNASAIPNNQRLLFDEVRFNLTDMTAPSITLISPVSDFNTTLNTTLFNFTVTDKIDMNLSCNVTIDGVVNISGANITNGSYYNFTVVNMSEGTHYWNVTCFDDSLNKGVGSTRNFTIVGAPRGILIQLAPDNQSINLSWIQTGYADYYTIYIIDSFADNFSLTPNITGITDANYTDLNGAGKTERFYRIATVKGAANRTNPAVFGKMKFELLNNSNAASDWNLFSIPLNITNGTLKNGTNNGYDLRVSPLYCVKTLWFYNSTISEFMRTDYDGANWIPATGSDNFTSIGFGQGYWAEVNKTCNLTIVGEVPTSNITMNLVTGWNIVGWHSPNASRLPSSFNPPYPVVVNPANSVKAIDRYNASTDRFEVTTHFIVSSNDWGWFPSSGNQNFLYLEPGKGYYYDVLNTATWVHKPNTEK